MPGKGSPSSAASEHTHLERLFQALAQGKDSPESILDQVIHTLGLQRVRQSAAVRSNLKPTFQDAQEQGVNLLHPGDLPTFQRWLLTGPLSRLGDVRGAAKANTINARASALSRLYTQLTEQGHLDTHPLRGLTLPRKEQDQRSLHSAADLRRVQLQLAAQTEDPLKYTYAAFLLIYQLAFTVTDLLQLTWQQLDLPQRRVLRRSESRLSDTLALALARLPNAQGPLLRAASSDTPVIALSESEFRTHYGLAFWQANLTTLSPSRLRLAGLRDHPGQGSSHQRADQLGFGDTDGYRRALKHAQDVAVALTPEVTRQEGTKPQTSPRGPEGVSEQLP